MSSIYLYTNNITRCLGIVVLLYARIQDHQFNNFIGVLLYYKFIIYKSTIKPNQYIFLTMSPCTNTRSSPTSSIETLANVLPSHPNSPYLKNLTLTIPSNTFTMTSKPFTTTFTLTSKI